LKVVVACVGRLKERYFKDAEAEYLKRLRPHCKVEVKELKTAAALEAAIGPRDLVIALDERGESQTSDDFARGLLERERLHGGGRTIVFAIGAADGHTEALRSRANRLISFGKQTIAHRLVRLLVLEQLYRGFSILAGEPYHRA